MKRILVPCDFSKPAVNAYRTALDIATKSRGVVHLLHVIELPVLHDAVIMPVLNFEEQLLNDLRKTANDRFTKITNKHPGEGVKVTTKVQFGAVSMMIQDYIESEGIELVVMGSHGATGLRELFIGSNAERVVRTSPVPVLVVKDYQKGPVKNIIFPNSLETENQDDLVMNVKAIQDFFKAKLHVVWINTPLNFTSDTRTMVKLREFAKRFMLKNYTLNVYNHTNEEQGILDFASAIKGSLITMGTHGRRGVSHIMLGSVAEDVVNHTQGMIWTYSLKSDLVEA